MTSLHSADLHLNSNQRDRHRWEILGWLEGEANRYGLDYIGLYGDITDAKDKHDAVLVNRLVNFFRASKNQWVIVKGNHDYVDPNTPFFGFLDCLENVRWITNPGPMKLPVGADYEQVLLLPATKQYDEDWSPFLFRPYEYIFMHGTFAGTLSENGFELPGIPVSFFDKAKFHKLYSGDIHTPGVITEDMEYIGAPYRVDFGDVYDPRVVLILNKDIHNLYPPLPSRHLVVVRQLADLQRFPEVKPDDQVKIRVRLKRSEFPEWRKIRRDLVVEAEKHLQWEVCGVELLELLPDRRRLDDVVESTPGMHKKPADHLRTYAERQKLSKAAVDVGLSFLNA